ncbi:MAG TPA: hypothetical protein VM490_16190, partial [Armatimonadaceae bacterium]|nr:hypothetical protein [Armatimonadaceae bacterium]
PGGAKVVMAALGALAIVLAVAAFLFLRPAGPVAVPTKFATFAAADGSFLLEAPDGWAQKPMGKAAPEGQRDHVGADGIRMQSGDAHVEVTFSSVAGLVGGQLLFGDEIVPESMVGARSAPIHRSLNKALKSRYKNYQAKPVARVPFESRMASLAATKDQNGLEMDLRLSEFTADGNKLGLGGKRHGYMAAIGGGDLIASVVCECKESDWPKLKPAFERVLASIAEGATDEECGGGIGVPRTGVTVPKVGGGY